MATALGWFAIAMPSVHDGFHYLMVIQPDEHSGSNLEGTMRPIRADGAPRLLQTMGFPLEAATWTTAPVNPGPDNDEGLDMENRWSWPHLLFETRQEWLEHFRWWAFPHDSAIFQAGAAREGRVLAAAGVVPAPLPGVAAPMASPFQEALAADREGSLPSWIRTMPKAAS
jgi:hypothetical protein